MYTGQAVKKCHSKGKSQKYMTNRLAEQMPETMTATMVNKQFECISLYTSSEGHGLDHAKYYIR